MVYEVSLSFGEVRRASRPKHERKKIGVISYSLRLRAVGPFRRIPSLESKNHFSSVFFFTFATKFAKMVGLLQVLMSLIFVRCFFFRLTRRIRRLEGFTCSLKKWYTKIIRIYKAFEWLLEETHKVLHWLLSTRKCMTNSPLYLKCVYSGWDGSLYHHLLIIVRFYSSEMVIGT